MGASLVEAPTLTGSIRGARLRLSDIADPRIFYPIPWSSRRLDCCQVAMIDNLLVDRPELHPNSFINARELTTAAASPLVTKLPL